MPITTTTNGTPILHHAEIDSTNAEAMRLVARGEHGPLWITADRQTAGRGRSGRQWTSDPGNLQATFLFATEAPLSAAHQLSLVAGVAAFEAIAGTGLDRASGLRLKWPNDVLLGDAKLGGILVESTTQPGKQALLVAIGFGVNLASHPEIPDRAVTSLSAHGVTLSPGEALSALDAALARTLATWADATGFPAIRRAWIDRSGRLGENISVQLPTERLTGTYAGLDEDGALLLQLQGGERRRCTYGDVTLDGTREG